MENLWNSIQTWFENVGFWFECLWSDIEAWFVDLQDDFVRNFIEGDRWKLLVTGLQNTLIITLWALLIGLALGIVVAIIRASYDKTGKDMRGPLKWIMAVINVVCKVYLTVIRGTPVTLQLLIMYLIILVNERNPITVAAITFGINSGAYVAEIVRAGIASIDNGQMEAGRSLGFGYIKTMTYIIIPQAFKNVLPALLNEFIALLKETSVAGYIGIRDLTKVAQSISGVTFSALLPLCAVALVYLAMVMLLTWLVGKLERRLRKSDNR